MAITVKAHGSATLTASAPGVVASKVVTVATMTTSDSVALTISSTAKQNVRDAVDMFNFQVVKAAGKFTIYANSAELPNNVVFDYIVITSSAE